MQPKWGSKKEGEKDEGATSPVYGAAQGVYRHAPLTRGESQTTDLVRRLNQGRKR